jgi:hypothetical protein
MKMSGLKRAFANGGELYPSQETEELMRRERMAMDDVMGRMKYARRGERQALGAELGNMVKGFGERYMPAGQGQPSENNFVMQNTLQNMDGLKQSLFDMAKYRPRAGGMAAQGVGAIGQITNSYLTEKEPAPTALDQQKPMFGFRQGGTVGVDQKGFIKGPGGVDNVPARVAETGEEIRVGAGERIVNQEQNAALEALAAKAGMTLEEYLAASTGEPVGPTMKKGLRGLAQGGFVGPMPLLDDEVRARAAANRLKAAASNVQVAPEAPTPTAPPAVPAEPTGRVGRAGAAVKSGLRTAGNVARVAGGVAGGLSGAYDMATGETPADQVAGGLKALAAVPSGPAQIVGGAAALGDAYLQSKTGKGLGHYLDKLAQLHPDYMANDPRAQAAATATPIVKPAAPAQPAAPTVSDPSYDRKEVRASSGNVASRGELDNANMRGLRQAGVSGEYKTIDTPNGKVYTGRDAKGQLVVNSNMTDGGLAAADAARDKQFAAAGYAKDGYGNWITPQRIADKQALAQMQSERAQFDAFSDQITDPRARAAGLRKVAFDMQNQELASKRGAEQAKLALEAAKFDQENRKIANLQGNADREFAFNQRKDQDTRIADMLKAQATDEKGQFNGKLYSQLQAFAGNFKSDYKEGSAAYYKDLMDKLGVQAAFAKDDGSLFRGVRTMGSDMPQGLRKQDGALWGSYLQDPATGRQLSLSEASKNLSPSQQRMLVDSVGDPAFKQELMTRFGLK